MMYRGKMMTITADQVDDVRHAIGENQVDFGKRFRRTRFSVIRWERNGTRIAYQSPLWEMWHGAISEAVHQSILRGKDEQATELRKLQIFSTK